MPQVFLLSPARCDGQRAKLLFNEKASFALAGRVRAADGAPIGDVFSFLSGLYFRGKLAYAEAFQAPPERAPGVLVITTNRGLVPPSTPVGLKDLRDFARVDIAAAGRSYLGPLRRDAEQLRAAITESTRVVLLGSIATDKYASVLMEVFGDRLQFPSDFVGRGDMSRGGLMLRCVRARRELAYVPVDGAIRHGKRPPKLAPLRPSGEKQIAGRSAPEHDHGSGSAEDGGGA